MCQLKSCLVLKDRVYCPDYDSHQDMLDKLGIKDDYLGASKTFVRVELTPPDGIRSLMDPLDRWMLKVDQDVTPEWWDEKADRQRVEEAVEAWRREHVFAEGEHSVKAGEVYAYGRATVKACDSATVEAYVSATVKAYGSATVEAYVSATVKAYGSATVKACDSATVEAWDSATVTAYGRATVKACDSATVEAYGRATVKACDSATVKAYGRATVKACDSATVKAYNHSTAVYPQKRRSSIPPDGRRKRTINNNHNRLRHETPLAHRKTVARWERDTHGQPGETGSTGRLSRVCVQALTPRVQILPAPPPGMLGTCMLGTSF